MEVSSGLVLGEKCSVIFKPEIQGWAELPLYLIPCSLIKSNGIWVFCGMRGSSFPPFRGPTSAGLGFVDGEENGLAAKATYFPDSHGNQPVKEM